MADVKPIDPSGMPEERFLYAVFDRSEDARQAQQALAALGAPNTWVLQGSEAASRLRQEHGEGGLGARIMRTVKDVGGEDLEAERYAIHLDHGRTILAVPCADNAAAERLMPALLQHGAYDVTYFGAWTMQRMSPGENAEHGLPTYEASTGADELVTGELPTVEPRR